MGIITIGILGGSGFVGSHLASVLVGRGFRVRVLSRSRQRSRHLWVLPDTDIIEANVHDQAVLDTALEGCDAVINLVGILNERRDNGEGFTHAHVELTGKVLRSCRKNGVRRLLHMSAMNANAFAPSYYLRSKAQAEDLVTAAARDVRATIFRPSVIFGPGDRFLNRFAQLLRLTPVAFPLACPDTRLQPVYVGDVCAAFCHALTHPDTAGQRYDLGGPDVQTLRAIVEYVGRVIGVRRTVVGLSAAASRAQAHVLEFFPGKPFSRDNYRSLQEDSVCRVENGLTQLAIVPTRMTAVAPGYLARRGEHDRYQALRARAQR